MRIEEIWARAREDAKDDFFYAAPDFNCEFVGHNPYEKGTSEYEEYEIAYEHIIMKALGY